MALAPLRAEAFLYPQMFSRDDPATRMDEGRTALDEGRLDDAAMAFTQAINTLDLDPPEMAEAYELRGGVRLQQGLAHQALADFRRSIEIAPGRATAFVGRARAWLSMDAAEQALNDLAAARQRCPDCPAVIELEKEFDFAPIP